MIKTIHDTQKQKKFMTMKVVLQKILEGILHTERKDKHNQEKNKSQQIS
jgi:hypothetical protein